MCAIVWASGAQHGAACVEDFAQVFPVLPGTRGALGSQVFQQGIKVGTRAVAELISVFEQLPAQSLEFGVVLLLGPACQACLLQQVKLVESHCRVRQMLLNPLDVSRRHVDADRLDLLRVAAMRAQVCRQTLNGGRFPSPCLQQAGRSQRAPRSARHQRQSSHTGAP